MFILDSQHSPAQAFLHGFLKGLAAPVMLFHEEAAPDLGELPSNKIHAKKRSVIEALAGDFTKIGDDLRVVIQRHDQDKTYPACASRAPTEQACF